MVYYNVEYSKSARAACTTCKQKIGKDELRVAAQSESSDGRTFTKYAHLECFKIPVKFEYPNDLDGEDTLKDKDQDLIKDYFEDDNNRVRSAKWKEQSKQAPVVPIDKLDDMSADEKRTALKEVLAGKYLEKNFNATQLKDMLTSNGQKKTGTKHELAIRVAQKMLEGTDPICPRCERVSLNLKKRKDGSEYWACPAYYDRDDDGELHHCGFRADIDPTTGKARKSVPKKKTKDEEGEESAEDEGEHHKPDDLPEEKYSALKRSTWQAAHGENDGIQEAIQEVDKMSDDEVDKKLRGDGSNAATKETPKKKKAPAKKATGTKRKRADAGGKGKKKKAKTEDDDE